MIATVTSRIRVALGPDPLRRGVSLIVLTTPSAVLESAKTTVTASPTLNVPWSVVGMLNVTACVGVVVVVTTSLVTVSCARWIRAAVMTLVPAVTVVPRVRTLSTRMGPCEKTTWLGSRTPLGLVMPMAVSNALSAAAVTDVKVSSTVSPAPYPSAARLVSSCRMSGPGVDDVDSERQAGRSPYISATGCSSMSNATWPRVRSVPTAGTVVRTPEPLVTTPTAAP